MALWERKGKTLVVLLAALAMGVAACGSDDDPNGSGGGGNNQFIDQQAAKIAALPQTVTFRQVAIGEEVTESVDIMNNGFGDLRISKIHLREESGGDYDGQREFFQGAEGWDSDSLTIKPGESHTLTVKYTPKDQVQDRGKIVIESNDPDNDPFEISLETNALNPEIFSPQTVSFQRVPPQEDPNWRGEYKVTQVQNLGAAPLEIDDIYVSGSDRFEITFPDPDAELNDTESDTQNYPQTLAPNETFDVRVWFKPDNNLPETGELIFESNDPENPQYVVTLNGNSGSPCLQVSPADELNFGQASLGQTSQKTVTIENCSRSSQLEVNSIEVTDDGGGVYAIQDGSLPEDLPDSMSTIDPGERANFVVTFEPATMDTYDGMITITSNDPASSGRTELPITGRGTDNECPTARATANIQGSSQQRTTIETIPLNTIEFDGSRSSDPDASAGDTLRYEWTILSRPQGSTQRLLPNNSSETPRLFLDLAGTYEIELKVYDAQGAASCGDPAVITIVAVPEDDVHIQLVWDTPSDPDQTDTFGTDLDLHYLHPNGRWDDPPWDIFWRNGTADWGQQGVQSDDPRLDIDDTDGAGPENINHSGLENLQYRAGVYYYSDNTLGASYATVRIYVRGQLALEVENKYMPRTGSFWDVAFIEWPRATVTNISRMYQGFPGSP